MTTFMSTTSRVISPFFPSFFTLSRGYSMEPSIGAAQAVCHLSAYAINAKV
jgi:hypothetical protein